MVSISSLCFQKCINIAHTHPALHPGTEVNLKVRAKYEKARLARIAAAALSSGVATDSDESAAAAAAGGAQLQQEQTTYAGRALYAAGYIGGHFSHYVIIPRRRALNNKPSFL